MDFRLKLITVISGQILIQGMDIKILTIKVRECKCVIKY